MAEGRPEGKRPMFYAVAAVAGVVAFVLFLSVFGIAFIPALFWAAVVAAAVLVGLLKRAGLAPFARRDPVGSEPVRSVPVDVPKPILKPAGERPGAGSAKAAGIRPTKELPGERELAERKGSWRYEPPEAGKDPAKGETEGSKGKDGNGEG